MRARPPPPLRGAAHKARAKPYTKARRWRKPGERPVRPAPELFPPRQKIRRSSTESFGASQPYQDRPAAIARRARSQPPPRKPAASMQKAKPPAADGQKIGSLSSSHRILPGKCIGQKLRQRHLFHFAGKIRNQYVGNPELGHYLTAGASRRCRRRTLSHHRQRQEQGQAPDHHKEYQDRCQNNAAS